MTELAIVRGIEGRKLMNCRPSNPDILFYDDPLHNEVKIYSKRDMEYFNHARLGQCPNCGANDWQPWFNIIDSISGDYKIMYHTCSYCGTRRKENV